MDLREMVRLLAREHNLILKNVVCKFFKLAIECKINVYSTQ